MFSTQDRQMDHKPGKIMKIQPKQSILTSQKRQSKARRAVVLSNEDYIPQIYTRQITKILKKHHKQPNTLDNKSIDHQLLDSYRLKLRKTIFQKTKYMIMSKSKYFSFQGQQAEPLEPFSPKNLSKAITFKSNLSHLKQQKTQKHKSAELAPRKSQTLDVFAYKLPIVKPVSERRSEKSHSYYKIQMKNIAFSLRDKLNCQTYNPETDIIPWQIRQSYNF